jgi:predicted transcriptional regulator YheO
MLCQPSLDKQWLFQLLGRIAKGIVSVIGANCEVVVHDFSDLNHSAIVVAGNISGRKPGAPVPDLNFVADTLNKDTQDQINYKIFFGEKEFQSSTLWVRDYEDNIIGAICINMDFSKVSLVKDILDDLLETTKEKTDLVVSNTFAKDLDELLHNTVMEFTKLEGIDSIDAMKLDDKLRLIETVEKRGLFKIRGATQCLAEILNVSRASIYNYRSGIKT